MSLFVTGKALKYLSIIVLSLLLEKFRATENNKKIFAEELITKQVPIE